MCNTKSPFLTFHHIHLYRSCYFHIQRNGIVSSTVSASFLIVAVILKTATFTLERLTEQIILEPLSVSSSEIKSPGVDTHCDVRNGVDNAEA
jgi:hypothetical protein